MSDVDFGAPIPVKELPPGGNRGGRASNEPGLRKWLDALKPGATYELGSKDEDGGHPVSRVTQLRKIAGTGFKVETRPIVTGKRYRIFATVAQEASAPTNGKATPPAK